MSDELTGEDLIIVEVSDFLDGAVKGPEYDAIAAKVQSDPDYQRIHAELVETRNALSGMQKARAPVTFAHDVTATIHKRSAGAFFGRRTFGDRVPFGALMIIAVLGICMIGYFLWASQTGSLKPDSNHAPTTEPIPSATP